MQGGGATAFDDVASRRLGNAASSSKVGLSGPIAKKLSSVAGRQTRMRFVYCLRGYAGVPRAGARVPPAARLTARRPSDCRSRPALFFSYVLQYTVYYYRIAVA